MDPGGRTFPICVANTRAGRALDAGGARGQFAFPQEAALIRALPEGKKGKLNA